MSVTVDTRDVGEVKERFRRESGFIRGLEDRNEDYIKRDMKEW